MYDKEKIYDEEIAPLLKKILEICKRENLGMAAQFYLKQEREDAEYENHSMFCTSFVIPGKNDILEEHREQLTCVTEAMKYGSRGKPVVMTSVYKSNE
jgi:hypothetical protein